MRLRIDARLGFALLLAFCSTAFGAADGSGLSIPDNTRVAMVVFEDLQCPDCAKAHPVLIEAARYNNVPLVIHDFPIKRHVWAFDAAIYARWFREQSPAVEIEFRSFVFQNQPQINAGNLREHVEQFAQGHGIALPANIDPEGRLRAAVQADFDLGERIGLTYVPLMFVIGRGDDPARVQEVKDTNEIDLVVARVKRVATP